MPRRKGIHCNLVVNMAKKRMETAKTNMLEAKAKNEEKRAHRLKMRLNRLDKRVSYVFIIYNRDFETISSIVCLDLWCCFIAMVSLSHHVMVSLSHHVSCL